MKAIRMGLRVHWIDFVEAVVMVLAVLAMVIGVFWLMGGI